MGRVSSSPSLCTLILRNTCSSEDENTMDEDVTMEDDSKPKTEEDDLKQYNLDNYDEDESMPGTLSWDLPLELLTNICIHGAIQQHKRPNILPQ